MTWLGDTTTKPTEAKKAKLETDRAGLVAQIEALGNKTQSDFRYPHQFRQYMEDRIKLAKEVTKIDVKLGRVVDRFSGAEKS
jgi:hypothetical protein